MVQFLPASQSFNFALLAASQTLSSPSFDDASSEVNAVAVYSKLFVDPPFGAV